MSLRFVLLASLFSIAPSLPVYADATDTEKLAFIRDNFNQVRDHSFYWQHGWLAIMGTSAVGQGVLSLHTESNKERYDFQAGALTSTMGVIGLLANPMRSYRYADALNANTADLAQAESWLKKAADRERYERSWINRLSAVVVNGAAGLLVAYDHKRPGDGWITFATGTIATEIKIRTSPTHMSETWDAYQRGDLSPSIAANTSEQRLHVAALGPLISIQYQF